MPFSGNYGGWLIFFFNQNQNNNRHTPWFFCWSRNWELPPVPNPHILSSQKCSWRWTIFHTSFHLFQAHFESKYFKSKATPAGIKRCLTADAIPTIFSFTKPVKKRKSPKKRPMRDLSNLLPIKPLTPSKVKHDHAYSYRSPVKHQTAYPYR